MLAGDVFNLSWEAPGRSAVEAVLALLSAHPELASALRGQLAGGAALTLLAGNHDAGLISAEIRDALLHKLELAPGAALEIAPWFVRRGGVHVEHGHFYDPDNAPAHPLAEWSPETEPLGIAITRRFVRPSGAHHFSHAHDTTPLAGIAKAFRVYGARTPLIIAEWFRVAGRLCLETRRAGRFDAEQQRGRGRTLGLRALGRARPGGIACAAGRRRRADTPELSEDVHAPVLRSRLRQHGSAPERRRVRGVEEPRRGHRRATGGPLPDSVRAADRQPLRRPARGAAARGRGARARAHLAPRQ